MILFYKQKHSFMKGPRTLDKLKFMVSTGGDTGAEARFEDPGPVYSDPMTWCLSTLSMRQKQEKLTFEVRQSPQQDPVTEEKQTEMASCGDKSLLSHSERVRQD